MSDVKLFKVVEKCVTELSGSGMALEKSLQNMIERNLYDILGTHFLYSEYSTGVKFRGRIDTLGLDENGNPVIIEYKRSSNENVINQGLFYLDWLLDHKAEYELLVQDKFGAGERNKIDWSMPRLICIAGDFTKYDEHAVQVMNRNIELIRYKYFDGDLLLLELVNSVMAESKPKTDSVKKYTTVTETANKLNGELLDLFEEFRAYAKALGDDVQEKFLKYYIAYKRLKNFACLEAHPSKGCLTVYLKIDPDSINLEEGFSRDVREIGHFGTGELEVIIKNNADFEKVKPLIDKSYEEN